MKMTVKTSVLVGALVMLSTSSQAASIPPNTLDMGQSPIINQAPEQAQPYLVPSVPTMVQNQVQEYISAQPTPAQIGYLKQNGLDIARMTASPYVEIPRPVVRSAAINLAPGEQPPIIRLAKGMLTSVVITDNEGNPWPIEKSVINAAQITDHTTPDQNGETNIITLEPNEAIVWSNISVTLKGKAIPVMFLLASGQPEVDMRVDARVPGVSPKARGTAGYYVGEIGAHSAVSEIDNAALHFLDGSIPSVAERMQASTTGAQAWLYNNSLYVKTRYDVLYPSYYAKASTGEGVHVYRFDNNISPIGVSTITFTQRGGQPITISFEKVETPYYNQ